MEEKQRRKKKHTSAQVSDAIKGSAGIKTTIGRRLNVHRHTVDRYLAEYPSAAVAYKNEVDEVGDVVEQVILGAIQAKDVETAKWYAKNKLKDRGYSERHEIRAIKEMSDAELIESIKQRTGIDLGLPPGSSPKEANKVTVH